MSVEHIRHFDMAKHTREQASKMIHSATLAIEGQAKLNAPYKTGLLRRSITHEVSELEGAVGTNVEYAEHQEYGTRYMDAQPYLRPAVDEIAGRIRRMWGG